MVLLLVAADGSDLSDARNAGEGVAQREILERAQFPDVAHGQGLIWYRFALRGMPLMGHNGGDSGVATQMYFRPSDDVGVIVLANGNWYWDGHTWPLQRIAVRLFEEADRG